METGEGDVDDVVVGAAVAGDAVAVVDVGFGDC